MKSHIQHWLVIPLLRFLLTLALVVALVAAAVITAWTSFTFVIV